VAEEKLNDHNGDSDDYSSFREKFYSGRLNTKEEESSQRRIRERFRR
jgi:hypothetical protein